jgi:hypothetical protein
MIDWNSIFNYINKEYNAVNKTPKEILTALYKDTKSTTVMCEMLGVSQISKKIAKKRKD